MRTIPDTTSPVSLEQAEEASARIGEQVERARRVVSDYRDATGAPPFDNDNG